MGEKNMWSIDTKFYIWVSNEMNGRDQNGVELGSSEKEMVQAGLVWEDFTEEELSVSDS